MMAVLKFLETECTDARSATLQEAAWDLENNSRKSYNVKQNIQVLKISLMTSIIMV